MEFDYQIAIPSHRRPEVCRRKTIAMLEAMCVDMKRVTIFLSDGSDRPDYEEAIPFNRHQVKIELGAPGITANRVHILKHYKKGTRVLMIDDDVEDIIEKDGKKGRPTWLTIDEIAEIGFGLCDRTQAKLWGIYPVDNPFYMKDAAKIGLKFVCGIFHGSYAGDPALVGDDRPNLKSADDYWATLSSFSRYGSTARIEWLCPRTKYFAEGGIAAQLLEDHAVEDRKVYHGTDINEIARIWPHLAKPYAKAGGELNLRLKPVRLEAFLRADLEPDTANGQG